MSQAKANSAFCLFVALVTVLALCAPVPAAAAPAPAGCDPYSKWHWYAYRFEHSGSWDLRLQRDAEGYSPQEGDKVKIIGTYRTQAAALKEVCARLFATNKFFSGAPSAVYEGVWHDARDFIEATRDGHRCLAAKPDADGDGAPNDIDKCPGTGDVDVDYDGCPCAGEVKQQPAKVNVTIRTIQWPLAALVEAKYADGRTAADLPIIFRLNAGGNSGDGTEGAGLKGLRWALSDASRSADDPNLEVDPGVFEVSAAYSPEETAQQTKLSKQRYWTDDNGRALIPLWVFPEGVPWTGTTYHVSPAKVSYWLKSGYALKGFLEAAVYEAGTDSNPKVLGTARAPFQIDRVATLTTVSTSDPRSWDKRVEMKAGFLEYDVHGLDAPAPRAFRTLRGAPVPLLGGETFRLDDRDQVIIDWIFPQRMAVAVKPGWDPQELTIMPEDVAGSGTSLEWVNHWFVESVGLVATTAGLVISIGSVASAAWASALGAPGIIAGFFSFVVGGGLMIVNRAWNPWAITMRSQVVLDMDQQATVYTLSGTATLHTPDGKSTDVAAGKKSVVSPSGQISAPTAFQRSELNDRALSVAAALDPALAPAQPAQPLQAAATTATLYKDDFSNAASGWPATATTAKESGYVGGEYLVRALGSKKAAFVWLDKSFSRDLTVEVDARSGALYGVAVRHAGKDFIVFAVTAEGRFLVSAYRDGTWEHLLPGQAASSPAIKTGGATNRLRVVCAGADIKVYANGQLLATVRDPAPVAGGIGFYAESPADSSSADAHFDNLVVSGPATQAAKQPTAVPARITVTLLDGDASKGTSQPAVIAYANRVAAKAPKGVTLRDSDGLWRSGNWVALTKAGQWIEATYAGKATSAGVQFWGDNNDGWARVLVDGVERWKGSIYGRDSEAAAFIKYLLVTGLPAGPHTVRVESLGQAGASGGDDVALYFFGFSPR